MNLLEEPIHFVLFFNKKSGSREAFPCLKWQTGKLEMNLKDPKSPKEIPSVVYICNIFEQ